MPRGGGGAGGVGGSLRARVVAVFGGVSQQVRTPHIICNGNHTREEAAAAAILSACDSCATHLEAGARLLVELGRALPQEPLPELALPQRVRRQGVHHHQLAGTRNRPRLQVAPGRERFEAVQQGLGSKQTKNTAAEVAMSNSPPTQPLVFHTPPPV